MKPLNAIAYGLSNGGSHMAAVSSEVFSASQSLAESATQQASGLEESSSTLEEKVGDLIIATGAYRA